ncbi:Hypothetical protein ABZS17I87_00077 [Kosakonia cowanii]
MFSENSKHLTNFFQTQCSFSAFFDSTCIIDLKRRSWIV